MKNLFDHPVKNTAMTIIFAVVAVLALWWLLALYGDLTAGRAFPVAWVYVLLLTAGTLFYRFMKPFINTWPPRIILTFLIHLISPVMVFLVSWMFGIVYPEQFIGIMPLIIIFGIMFWGLLIVRDRETVPPGTGDTIESDTHLPAPQDKSGSDIKPLERISVKQGSEIHILKTDEIYYLEAYGDYVLIYTETGKYIKEQTMRYFETNLPKRFVRIHRSHMINTDFMIRLELFGKESYHIRLRNGTSLRASNAGYKQLKQKLDL